LRFSHLDLTFAQQSQTEITFLLTLNKHKSTEAPRASHPGLAAASAPDRIIREEPARRPRHERPVPVVRSQAPPRIIPVPSTPSAFSELGLSSDVAALLSKQGISEPFPIQALTIPDALAGRDVCGKARTGSGKTLAFGLPSVELTPRCPPRRPHSLVLAPTRELANQIATNLRPFATLRGLRVAAIFGGASMHRQSSELRSGVDILVATPGRLNDLLERGELSVAEVGIVVVDEADQMADFGFLPQVERILDRIEGQHQTLLFSATLSGDVDRLIKRYQHDPVYHEAAVDSHEEVTMQHRFIGVADAEKVRLAAAIACGPGRTLLFTRTQRGADRLARLLDREGIAAGVLHGGVSQPRRERALKAFADGRSLVLVATNIAARGIHVDDVETVVHFDLPEDAKTYLHRSGRTARAGASGLVVTLVQDAFHEEARILRRDAGVREAVVAMNPDDPRLRDLGAWQPPLEDPAPARPQLAARPAAPRRGGGRWIPRNERTFDRRARGAAAR
jgi:superfamily II DNA/RNA helicase